MSCQAHSSTGVGVYVSAFFARDVAGGVGDLSTVSVNDDGAFGREMVGEAVLIFFSVIGSVGIATSELLHLIKTYPVRARTIRSKYELCLNIEFAQLRKPTNYGLS